MLLLSHLSSAASQFLPASEIAIASGENFDTISCTAIIFSALAIPPWILIVWRQNLFLSVVLAPCTVNTVAGPMSNSVCCVLATYLAQAVATSVDSVPAAASSASAPDTASTEGSCDMAMRRHVAGVMGMSARAGRVSWAG
jgi:hypothetical protein